MGFIEKRHHFLLVICEFHPLGVCVFSRCILFLLKIQVRIYQFIAKFLLDKFLNDCLLELLVN